MPSKKYLIERTAVLYLSGMIIAMTVAHVMFKFAGNYTVNQNELISSFVLNPWLWVGLLSSGVGTLFWLLTLRKQPLASSYPWTALIYVFTPIASVLLFDDVLSDKFLLGMVFIVIGVFITAGGVDSR